MARTQLAKRGHTILRLVTALCVLIPSVSGRPSSVVLAGYEACGFGHTGPANSSVTNQGIVTSGTSKTAGDCTAVRVRVWLNVGTSSCTGGSMVSGACQGDTSGSPSWTVMTTAKRNDCGPMSGHSRHYGNGGGVFTEHTDGLQSVGPFTVTCPDPPDYEWQQSCPNYGWNWESGGWQCESPIVIATGPRRPYTFTSPVGGVVFDIDADGDLDRVAWTTPGSDTAFLAIDRNGNGTIDDGSELFGEHTLEGARHGFEALAAWQRAESGFQRGEISDRDPFFHRLLLWHDRDSDGQSQRHELEPASRRLAAIYLAYSRQDRIDRWGNNMAIRGRAAWRNAPGLNVPIEPEDIEQRLFDIYDVYLTGTDRPAVRRTR